MLELYISFSFVIVCPKNPLKNIGKVIFSLIVYIVRTKEVMSSGS